MKPATLRAFVFTTLILFYGLLVAGTYNGILASNIRLMSAGVLTGGAVLWAFLHIRNRWAWQSSPLDPVMPLWIIAFALSWIANPDMSRRIVMGLWYMGLYIAVWYVLHDFIFNRALKRETLIDALIVIGAFVTLIGFVQFYNGLRSGTDVALLRPVSVLGNANTLAGFLIMILPLVFERIGSRNPIFRVVMTFYAIFGVLLLLLTFSRGGWIGMAGGVTARILLYAYEHGLHTVSGRRDWWSRLTRTGKTLLLASGIGTLAFTAAAALFLMYSLNLGGRSLSLRTFIYDTAFAMIAEKPVAGNGLFTFGEGLVRFNSTPPTEPHSHAHNLFLNVTAELGWVGLAALLVTLYLIFRAAHANLSRFDSRDKRAFRAGIASLTAYGVHQLLDFPSVMPTIFLTMMIVLALTIAHPPDQRTAILPRRVPAASVLSTLVVALIAATWFDSITYNRYTDTLRGVTLENARERADQLQSIIELDPSMPVYHQQQGYLYAIVGDDARAAAAWERYTQTASTYVVGWANLGAVYAEMGRYDEAVTAMRRAVALAPEFESLSLALDRFTQASQTGILPPPLYPNAEPFASDIPFSENINPIQFLRLSLPRQFLPQLGFSP